MSGFATAHDWAQFLRPIASAVRNPPTPDDFKGRCAALAFAVHVRASDLTPARQREICRSAEFWPSVAEIEKVFAEVWKDRARSAAIRSGGMAQIAAPKPSEPIVRSQAEIDAAKRNAADTIAFLKEMAALKERGGPREAKPLPLHPAQLLAQYETLAASGNEAAAFRAAQLRKALSQ